MADWLKVYHSMPARLRTAVFSAKGYVLRRRRYGKGFQERVNDLKERESWSRSDWKYHQKDALKTVLLRSLNDVPYYRSLASNQRLDPDPQDLPSWPILDKESLRARPKDFVADDLNTRRLVSVYTSGTTGKPVQIYRSRETEQTWYAMHEVRIRNPWNVKWTEQWAILGGRLVVPSDQEAPPFWVHNYGLNQLYLSSYHLAPKNARAYLDALSRFEPAYILAYTSAVHALARFILDYHHEAIRPKMVITNAEPVLQHQREQIEQAFCCPVVETYGMTEMGVHASQCKEGSLHYWPDLGYLELLDEDGRPVADGEVGHVVCTTLLNCEQPLIRYRTGDMAVAAPADFQCRCGSSMPVLTRVEGRSDDVIVTRSGRQIGRLDTVFKSGLDIKEAQIVQRSLDDFLIRFVPANGESSNDISEMVSELKARVGDCSVEVESVDAIERTAAGKFRAVVSHVKQEHTLLHDAI